MPSTGMPIGSLVALVTIHERFLFCFVCLSVCFWRGKVRNTETTIHICVPEELTSS